MKLITRASSALMGIAALTGLIAATPAAQAATAATVVAINTNNLLLNYDGTTITTAQLSTLQSQGRALRCL